MSAANTRLPIGIRPRPLLLAILLAGLPWTPAPADPAEAKGLQLALEADRRDSGYKDSKGDAEMIIRKRRGSETRRSLEISVLEDRATGDLNLVRFRSPPDVRGTALLTRTGLRGEDEQWLYLPALKRTKRIASANRSGAFMGSEFAYEDFALRRPEDYAYRYLQEEVLEGRKTWVLERRPRYSGSGYGAQMVWMDQASYRLAKVQFRDGRDRPFKTLEASGYRLHAGRFWRADTLRMGNSLTGDTTWLVWTRQGLGVGLGEKDFSRGSLGAP